MSIQLSQKERMILEDEKHMEEICVKKYTSYAEQAKDPALKQLFTKIAGQEQHHYDMVDDLLNGKEPPNMQGSGGQGQQKQQQQGNQNTHKTKPREEFTDQGFGNAMDNVSDEVLCSDLLATEKYVASTYNVAVFEAANPVVRQAVQHIQQEEQGHGQMLFDYMQSHGMYQVE
ncbi:spore coat protein [Vallitalea pronyensis]|uniref:Spore coat protein n=1 Tax=Vallitalea pronyensis TaxID=1348613 RepID=A0A8J8SGR5_9FIRM|nr:spore coat protein [Vallitalea pronyensis]QUI22664.1 spore coat protein [Vallitalea pronyensis]